LPTSAERNAITTMLRKLIAAWRSGREKSRQHAVDRALYKASGGTNPRNSNTGPPPDAGSYGGGTGGARL
jgi:hypothetical protein